MSTTPNAPIDKGDLVAASPLFGALAAHVQAELTSILRHRTADRDETIYLRGDEAEAFFGVASGRVRFSAASVDGKELVLDYAERGQWFGEIGLFDAGPRVVDAHAAEATELWYVERRALLDLCRREPALPLRVVELFSARIRIAEEIIVDAAFLNLPARLAKRLLTLAERAATEGNDDATPSLKISQDELGRLTGVTRESAGKQLKAWEREGLLELDYGKIRLREPRALRRIVEAALADGKT